MSHFRKSAWLSLGLLTLAQLSGCGVNAGVKSQVSGLMTSAKKAVAKADTQLDILLNGMVAADWESARAGQVLTFSVKAPVGSKVVWRTNADARSPLDRSDVKIAFHFAGGYDVSCTVTTATGEILTDLVRVLVAERPPLPTPMPFPPVPFPPRP